LVTLGVVVYHPIGGIWSAPVSRILLPHREEYSLGVTKIFIVKKRELRRR
jgi:hypothetical protein